MNKHGKAVKQIVAGALLGLMAAGAARADGPVWQPLLGVGLTVGGDKFIEGIQYSDGYSEDIAAGQFLQNGETTAQLKILKAPFIYGMSVLCAATAVIHLFLIAQAPAERMEGEGVAL